MFEKQFNKFIDILNSKLLTVKKKEYKFEIKFLTKYLDGSFLHISSINDKQFLNDVEVSKEYMEQYKRIFSLNAEMKNIKIDEINNLISFLKGLLSKNYQLKYNIIGKKLCLYLLSNENSFLEKTISKYLLHNLKFDILLQSGINSNLLRELFQEKNLNEEIVFEKIFSLLIALKSSMNISDILKSLFESFKEVNFNNKIVEIINAFCNKYFENKESIDMNEIKELNIGQYKKNFSKYLSSIRIVIGVILFFCISLKGLNLDNIKISFYNKEMENGISINIRMKNITELIEPAFK